MRNLFILTLILCAYAAQAQKPGLRTVALNQPVIKLVIPTDATKGSNGAAVAYDPVKKLYYAAFAGNSSYPLIVFDAKGTVVGKTSTMGDLRGLWYNTYSHALEGNLYDHQGFIRYVTDAKGVPTEFTGFMDDSVTLDVNTSATYDADQNLIICNNDARIDRVNPITKKKATAVDLQAVNTDLNLDNLNYTSCLYTGKKGAEYGLVDIVQNQILLFDKATGNKAMVLQFDADYPLAESFNVASCNNMVFVFDKDARQWQGYKIP